MAIDADREILQLTEKLLQSIVTADWPAYEALCDPSITAFEPEAHGHLVEGLAYHKFYFQLGPAKEGHNTTICSPSIRVAGDMAVISYIRLNQRLAADGSPKESVVEETRVWQKKDGRWKHVHFHRSMPAG